MKKIFYITITFLLAIPAFSFAAFGATWQATSTTGGLIFPGRINGAEQSIYATSYIASSTTATSTFMGNVLIGTDSSFGFNSGQPLVVAGNLAGPFQTNVVNKNVTNFGLACQFLGNSKTTNLGFFSQYYGGMCFGGANYNIPGFNGLKSDGLAVFASDGALTLGSASANAASSSIRFQAGSGLDDSTDMILTGSLGRLGLGTSTPGGKVAIAAYSASATSSPLLTIASSTGSGATSTMYVITAQGYHGIATTTPRSAIHTSQSTSIITPHITLDGNITAANGGHAIDFKYNGSPNSFGQIAGVADSTLTGGDLTFGTASSLTNAANERMRITGSGRFGFGTSSPLTISHWAGTSFPKFLFDGNGASFKSFISFNPQTAVDGNVGVYWSTHTGTPTTGILSFEPQAYGNRGTNVGASPIIAFNSNTSNIGIGTTTPRSGTRLEAYSSNSATTLTTFGLPSISITNSNTTANNFSSLVLSQLDTNGAVQTGVQLSAVHTDHTAASIDSDFAVLTTQNGTISEKFRILNSGNIGIGTTSPYARLSVVGEGVFANITATSTNATSTFQQDVVISKQGQATSTLYLYSKTATFGGQIILEDVDAAGCTEITALNGTLSSKTVTCPTEI